MIKSFVAALVAMSLATCSQTFAFCDGWLDMFSDQSCGACSSSFCWSADVEGGWRNDYLSWKTSDIEGRYVSDVVDDKINFNDINSYIVNGQLKWVSSEYYIKASADYGWAYKGRAHEHFKMKSPVLVYPVSVSTSEPIKRSSEVYDFAAAAGYPLAFLNCRLSIVPLIGFSYHRQHLLVKGAESSSFPSSSSWPDRRRKEERKIAREERRAVRDMEDGPDGHIVKRTDGKFRREREERRFFRNHSSSSFFVDSSTDFITDFNSDPFSSSSDSGIASALGLFNPHHSESYRFTWYGFYLGADMSYALDGCWTLFWNTEFHFLDNCHRKRKSWTGVDVVDDYHKKGGAYGFDNVVGANVLLYNNWYGTVSVDFSWWKGHSKHDDLRWKKVDAKAGLAYVF